MTRTVTDTALMMGVLSQPDARDHMSLPYQDIAWLDLDMDLRGVRIGLLLDAGCGLPVDPEILDAVQAAARLFEAAGAIVEPMKPWMTPAMLDGVDRFWRTRSAIDLAALSEERRGKILPFIRAWAESGGGQSGEAVFRSYYETVNVRARTVAACAPYDYVLSPVAPVVAYNAEWPSPTNEVATTMHHIGFTLPYNMSEQPAASVNCGYTRIGLPIGLQIAGARFDDLGVLRVARAWERMRPAQRAWPQPPRAPDDGRSALMPGRPRGARRFPAYPGDEPGQPRTTHALAIGNDQARDEHILARAHAAGTLLPRQSRNPGRRTRHPGL